jgi:hypothetical protein
MLRFDLPRVASNVTRMEAFVTTVVSAAALALAVPWLMALPALQGAIRGVFGHRYCPAHHLWLALFKRLGVQGRLEDAGPKMFANKVLLVASAAALALAAAGSGLWRVPCVVLLVFSTLEWAFSFCAACWVYGAWYRRFPPAGT